MAARARFTKRITGGSRLRRAQGLGVPIVPSKRDERIHSTLMRKHAADAIVIGEESLGRIREVLAATYRSEGIFPFEISEILDHGYVEPVCPACAPDAGELELFDASALGGLKRIAQIAAFVNQMRRKYAREFNEALARSRVSQIEESIDETNGRRWRGNIRSSAKADPLVPDKFGELIVRRDPQPSEAVKSNWTKLNTDLLKTSVDDIALQRGQIVTVPDFYFDKYERILTDGRRQDRRVEDIVNELQDLTGQTLRRSDALASDQVSAHNSNLERERSTEAGITHFLWVSRRDRRVRGRHVFRDSKLYSYKHKFRDEKRDGPPGVPPRCRCRAQPSLRRTEADPEDFRELIPVSHPNRQFGETPSEFLKRTKFSAPIPVQSNRPALIPRLIGREIVFGDPLEGTEFPRPRLRTKK